MRTLRLNAEDTSGGVFLIYVPAGLIVLGAFLVLLAVMGGLLMEIRKWRDSLRVDFA